MYFAVSHEARSLTQLFALAIVSVSRSLAGVGKHTFASRFLSKKLIEGRHTSTRITGRELESASIYTQLQHGNAHCTLCRSKCSYGIMTAWSTRLKLPRIIHILHYVASSRLKWSHKKAPQNRTRGQKIFFIMEVMLIFLYHRCSNYASLKKTLLFTMQRNIRNLVGKIAVHYYKNNA